MRKILFYILLITCGLTACKKEIDFDYNEIAPIVVIEGRVTNEGTEVMITRSRSMTDSVRGRCIPGAVVTVSANGVNETIAYDPQAQVYRSSFKGTVGETYRLTVDFENQHYEGTATMLAAAPVISSEYLWYPMLDDRMVVYELWAADPEPTERNYFWYRMDRVTHHPHLQDRKHLAPYRWGAIDDRGDPQGMVHFGVYCMSERMAEEDEEENWERILYEGDTLTFQLMPIDRASFDYFTSLRAGQSGGANPRSNLSGGCLGYFTAGSVTRADTMVFHYDSIKPHATIQYDYGE